MNNRISVIIIDDHQLVLNGFEFILNNHVDIKLVNTFTRADALTLLETNKFDVVLANINMPRINGIDDTLSIKKNQSKTRVNAISNISEGIF